MNLDSIKHKIQALLNLGAAGAGATEHEAENALRFARRLMLQHNVTEADLPNGPHEAAADAERTTYGQAQGHSVGSNLTGWECTLGHAICALIGTVNWYRGGVMERRTKAGTLDFNEVTGKPKRHQAIYFFGPEADARDARELMEEWTTIVIAMARAKFGGALRGDGRSYCEGFCMALWQKMKAIKAEEQVQIEAQKRGQLIGTNALVVVNANQSMDLKRQKGAEWLAREQGVRLRKGSKVGGGGSHNAGAYGAGQSDGQRANFNRNVQKKLRS